MSRKPGRRPGKQDTRAVILEGARDLFAERGFDGTSIRAIAARASVDPALVHHYFGTKEDLFLAVIQPGIDPTKLLPGILAGGTDGIGERLVRTFLGVMADPAAGPSMRGLLRTAIANETTARLMREFFAARIVRVVIEELNTKVPAKEVPFRASLVASQLFGMVAIRYLLGFEPLASADPEAVIAALAPTFDRYIAGDIGL